MPDGLHSSLRRIAPPRFLVFAGVLVAVSVGLFAILADRRLALLIGFDVAALVFLASVLPLLREDTRAMRQRAARNDANRVAMLAITVLLSIVILFAIGTLIASKQALHWQGLALIVGTLDMTFQTSDVVITGAHIRKVVLGHTSAAFLFNVGVLAFAVNALGGL